MRPMRTGAGTLRKGALHAVLGSCLAGVTPASAEDLNEGKGDYPLFVDRDLGSLGGACTRRDPCARITDALERARALRYGLETEALPVRQRIQIRVRSSSEPYTGSWVPEDIAADPTLEALPLLLNVSNLELRGESRFVTGSDGWIDPDGPVTRATTLQTNAPLPADRNISLIALVPTLGMSPDQVSVRGFVLDAQSEPGLAGFLVQVDRARDFEVRDMLLQNGSFGVAAAASSGVVSHSLIRGLGEGMLVFAGTSRHAADVTVHDVRLIENAFGGIAVFGTDGDASGIYPPFVDFGAHGATFQREPGGNQGDATRLRLLRVDSSRNSGIPIFSSGLRIALHGPRFPPLTSTGHLFIDVRDSRFNDNDFAFVIDAGFPFRSDDAVLGGNLVARFDGNEASGSLTAKALITFTRVDAAQTLPDSMTAWQYLRAARYSLHATSGELSGGPAPEDAVWIDDPDTDPGAPAELLDNGLYVRAR